MYKSTLNAALSPFQKSHKNKYPILTQSCINNVDTNKCINKQTLSEDSLKVSNVTSICLLRTSLRQANKSPKSEPYEDYGKLLHHIIKISLSCHSHQYNLNQCNPTLVCIVQLQYPSAVQRVMRNALKYKGVVREILILSRPLI